MCRNYNAPNDAIIIRFGFQIDRSLDDQVTAAIDKLYVIFGEKILELVPGRVSTEVDAR